MCDTFVAVGEACSSSGVVFGKNSDREPDEAQALELHPHAEHPAGARVDCTYLQLPQARRTARVLLSRPHWLWGAEMGVNEHNVAIGNEAVFTRAPRQRVGLTGMDLVRLGLERSASADQALDLITALIGEYGQGGPAGYRDRSFCYDNSFIIADPTTAWVLETAGKAWVAERVSGVRAISNGLSIRTRWDRQSDNLHAYARSLGLSRGKGTLDFARTFSRPWITRAAAAASRRACNEAYLQRAHGAIGPLLAMRALRRHGAGDDQRSVLGRPLMTVCAHASWWPSRRAGQTTSSLVASLERGDGCCFVTGTSAPCTSVFKPLWLESGLPAIGPTPGPHFDARSLWWRHERLHRKALAALPEFLVEFARERDELERGFVHDSQLVQGALAREALSVRAFESAEELEQRMLERFDYSGPGGALGWFWARLDRRSRLPAAG